MVRQPPLPVQREIEQEWKQRQNVDLGYLRARYPEWWDEIREFVLGLVIDSEELPDDLEDLVCELVEGESYARARARNRRARRS